MDALSSVVREWSSQYGNEAEFIRILPSPTAITGADQSVETNLYLIVQEALNNGLKHAQAESVGVLLQHRENHIELIVEDDGRGIDSEIDSMNGNTPGGLGLIGMRERAALLKGNLEIESSGVTALASWSEFLCRPGAQASRLHAPDLTRSQY